MLTDRVAAALKHLNETADTNREAYLDGLLHQREYLMRTIDDLYSAALMVQEAAASLPA